MTRTSSTSASSEPAVSVSGLSKIYPDSNAGALLRNFGRTLLGRSVVGTCALADIDFSLERGEALGIVGRNGSGKSTLLQILSGSLRPTTGSSVIRGRLGTLLDLTSGINPDYTGAENALVLGMLAGLSRAEVRARMDEIKAFSGLGDAFGRAVRGYSSGMTMRLGFSAAIHSEPEVLLIDEALAVGDAFYQQRCLRKMRALRDEGVTIVLVTHDPSAVISLCDRALWLEGGRIQEQGSPSDVLRLYLAARYQDDCDLTGALEPLASLAKGQASDFAAARPIERMDERFGDGRARVVGFEMRNGHGETRASARPGRPVQIVLTIEATDEVRSPLVGFTVRNRLGDVVTATNTEHEGISIPPLAAGSAVDVAFHFDWPPLASGPITFSPAVADGSIAAHVMCDWVENALLVESENDRGLFGWWSLENVEVLLGSRRPVASSETPSVSSRTPDRSGEAEPTRPGVEERIEFSLDEPRDAQVDPSRLTEEHELLFSGWSFSESGDAVEVAFRVGDREQKVVSTAGLREDVARAHPEVRHAARSGFAALVPMPEEAGSVRCQVEVRASETSRIAADFELEVPARPMRVEGSGEMPASIRSVGGRPRILFVTHSLNLEGAPRSLFEMADGLSRDDFEIDVLSPAEGPLAPAWEKAGVTPRILPVDVRVGGRDDYEAMIRRVAGLVAVGRPDLIITNTLETFWAVHVARELGVESIWIVRESEEPQAYFHSRLPTRIAERGVHALSVARRVVFVAEATHALFHSSLAPNQSVVIPNGLDLKTLDTKTRSSSVESIRKDAGVGPERPLLLCVGTPCARKGQLELLDALSLLREKGHDFCCVFLGTTECDYLDRMRDSIERLSLTDFVALIPPTTEPLPYFAAADLVVCPSIQESLPRVVLEAMAFAKPIVAAEVFGVPELIRDGREGHLVAAGDVDAMATAIAELMDDPARASTLGRNARARVEEKFTLERCVDAYTALVQEVFEASRKISGSRAD